MSDTRKAGNLIITDLALFNESVVLFENKVQPEVLSTLDKTIEVWVNQKGWGGVFDWSCENGAETCWFAPQAWIIPGETNEGPDANVSFCLHWLDGGDSLAFPLADLCGVGEQRVGFCFDFEPKAFGGKAAWKRAIQPYLPTLSEKMKRLGFVATDSYIFALPFQLDVQVLGAAWEDENYEAAFAPVLSALDAVEKAVPLLDAVLSQINNPR